MNIQALYEYVILRDILAYILPGGISLAGIALIVQAYGVDRWNKVLYSLSDLGSWALAGALVAIAFLVGHVLDLVYRNLLQRRDWYRRPYTIRKMLTGSPYRAAELGADSITCGTREAVGEFFNIDWNKTSVDQWIDSGKAFEATVILGYWIEQEDSRVFNTEIGRPVVQAHFLHASGLAFILFGICLIVAESIRWIGLAFAQTSDPLANFLTVASVWLFGALMIRQGGHKRDILIEHTYRVFYMIWRRKHLGHKPQVKTDAEPATSRDLFPASEL